MSDLDAMRAFVSAVMTGAPITAALPISLVRTAHLGPIAYKRGIAAFRDEYAASAIMAIRRGAALREVAGAFGERGVGVAMLKGIGLAGTVYPDAAERPMHDLDLLVREPQLSAAIDCLLARGFERFGYTRKLSSYYHAVVFARGDIVVELHRNIMQKLRTRLALDELWERSAPDDNGARRLAPVDALLICALHVARHELAVPVLNFVDIQRMWDALSEAERRTLHERADAYRVARAVAAVLATTELLRAGRAGHADVGRGSDVLPTTGELLAGAKPRRLRQIHQKLLLTQGAQERLGLGAAWITAIVDGWRRGLSFDQR